MKKICFLLLLFFVFLTGCLNKEEVLTFKLGIDMIDEHMELFQDKKVGLITNPTGINENYESSIDVL